MAQSLQARKLYESLPDDVSYLSCLAYGVRPLVPESILVVAHTPAIVCQIYRCGLVLVLALFYIANILPLPCDGRNKLYCLLTERAINRTQEEVDRHLHGYRFCKRFAKKTAGETIVGETAVRPEGGEREGGGEAENKEEAEEMWVPPEYLGREKKAKKRASGGKVCGVVNDKTRLYNSVVKHSIYLWGRTK